MAKRHAREAPQKKIQILIADDHALVRETLREWINSHPDMEVVGEAANGREACEQAQKIKPDVVIMDVMMPVMDGVEATRFLHQAEPKVRVLALTGFPEATVLRRMLAAGASGFLLKAASGADLIDAIQTVLRGQIYLDPAMTEKVAEAFISRTSEEPDTSEKPLSQRETEVLRLHALGYAIKEIASRLGISIKTVETYKARVMEKLNLHSRVELIRYAQQHGWLKDEGSAGDD